MHKDETEFCIRRNEALLSEIICMENWCYIAHLLDENESVQLDRTQFTHNTSGRIGWMPRREKDVRG